MPETLSLPVVFALTVGTNGKMVGGRPLLILRRPRPARGLTISGVTRNASGVALGGCTVMLFRSTTDELMETVVSDGSGVFSFGTVGPGQAYYVVAYLPGSPDVAGTSVNTLVGS